MDEMIRATGMALTDEPARNKFAIRVECNPRPNIARALCLHLRRAILFLCAYEAPDFIALNPTRFEIAKSLVLIFGADSAKIAKQFHNRCAMHASHARNGAQRIAFDQRGNDRFLLLNTQFTDNMLERSSSVKREKVNKFHELLLNLSIFY